MPVYTHICVKYIINVATPTKSPPAIGGQFVLIKMLSHYLSKSFSGKNWETPAAPALTTPNAPIKIETK